MPHDKRGIVSIIMGKTPKPEMEEEKEYGNKEALQEAAREIMDAFERKDSAMMAEAMKSFIEMCKYDSEESEEE